jgi:L-ascorbate metabolism protein UlaG (beta-lactamase superfamily)
MLGLRIILVLGIAALHAAAQQSSPSVLESVRSHRQGVAVWWVGNAGWLIKSDGLLIGLDLDLSEPQKVQPPVIKPDELASELDVAFVSHHHGDHCNVATIRALATGKRTTFVLPQTCVKRVASANIPQDRLVIAEPLRPF